jgi:Rv0078B-related antitoxin
MGYVGSDQETARDRLLQTFEMFEFGVELMAGNLRRRHPHASPAEIERLLEQWLATRPGAEGGDSDGTPAPLPAGR